MEELPAAVERIRALRRTTAAGLSVLAAVTGIDGSGKGYVAARLAAALRDAGLQAAPVGIDGWLNLPPVRFSASDPAGVFYERAIRFDELFSRLVLPLRQRRSLELEFDFTEETAREYRRQRVAYRDVDVILLEGIYLLKRELAGHYDVSFWIDCSFETALERAIARAQEGLPPEETVRAYETIYFPAQRLHFRRDAPWSAAAAVIPHDPRLGRRSAASP